jgi:heme exporter protein A
MDGAPCLPSALTAYQGHIDAFKPQLTPREALGFWAQIMDQPDISKALLAQVGLKTRQHIPCGQLSAGQRRRLSLARLMLSSKALWVLDEPTAAMDAEGTSLIAQIIAGHIARGGSAVIASHNAPEITGTRTRRIMLSAKAAA